MEAWSPNLFMTPFDSDIERSQKNQDHSLTILIKYNPGFNSLLSIPKLGVKHPAYGRH